MMDFLENLLNGDTADDVLSQADVENLLSEVAHQESKTTIHTVDGGRQIQPKETVQPYDFRHPVYLSAAELRKLRQQHEVFVRSLAARLSIYLRLEIGLQLSRLQTIPYKKFVESLFNPAHLVLFKLEPLRGICVLDINSRLGLTIVDRMMGGPGHSVSVNRDFSEIETALLDQVVQVIIGEWGNHWSNLKDMRPVVLGHENNASFLSTSPPDTVVLVLSMEVRVGDCLEQMQIGFPYHTIEPLIKQLTQKFDFNATDETPPPNMIWNSRLDDIKIPVTAEWINLEMSARELASLKVGDMIPLNPDVVNEVQVRLAHLPKYIGRLGSQSGQWAVELTNAFRP